MTLKKIEIKNIKGISSKSFELNIVPNKPSILVASNGFGKSSFSCAFNSMNNSRIALSDENFYNNSASNLPSIAIEYEKSDGEILMLSATNGTNTISSEFDFFVIKSPLKPKGATSFYGGRATASLEIESVVVIDSIPQNENFNNYSITDFRTKFGKNGRRILPNITPILANLIFIEKLTHYFVSLTRANGVTFITPIDEFISDVNIQDGKEIEILEWIEQNWLSKLESVPHFSTIANLVSEFDFGFTCKSQNYLVSIQLFWLYNLDSDKFKKACAYTDYKLQKKLFDDLLSTFNTTWKNIKPTQNDGKLIVNFPKATDISNGQRDILSFISMLFRAQNKLKKNASILVIDEVFDYLDDANLVTAQYYITKFIDQYKETGKSIYPLILTHLNPNYFKNFVFSNQKIYYLEQSSLTVNPQMINLLRKRNELTIKDDISSKLFHYHPDIINKRAEFRALSLSELWGEGNNFKEYINQEMHNYLNEESYDPFAICCSLRVRIEEMTYNKLVSDESREGFLNTHKTRSKLDYSHDMGISLPEAYYLLGIIYNDGMHWKDGFDNITPVASKLENKTIKKIIQDVFN
jgi:hypothetical protein